MSKIKRVRFSGPLFSRLRDAWILKKPARRWRAGLTARAPLGGPIWAMAEIQSVSDVIRSGWLTMGAKTFESERQFARYVGASHAIAVSSLD